MTLISRHGSSQVDDDANETEGKRKLREVNGELTAFVDNILQPSSRLGELPKEDVVVLSFWSLNEITSGDDGFTAARFFHPALPIFFPLPREMQEFAELFILQQAAFPLPPRSSPPPDFFRNDPRNFFRPTAAHARTPIFAL